MLAPPPDSILLFFNYRLPADCGSLAGSPDKRLVRSKLSCAGWCVVTTVDEVSVVGRSSSFCLGANKSNSSNTIPNGLIFFIVFFLKLIFIEAKPAIKRTLLIVRLSIEITVLRLPQLPDLMASTNSWWHQIVRRTQGPTLRLSPRYYLAAVLL